MKNVKKGLVVGAIHKDARLHPRPLILGMPLPGPALPYLHFFNTLFGTIEISQKKLKAINNK
jgi:hypothetical protein